MTAEERIAELKEQKDGAYRERDQLVAALSKFLPAWLERHPEEEEWEDDWRWTVFIDGPTGQMTWHIHDSELGMFDHLSRSGAHRWDGHSTERKYERLAALKDTYSGATPVDGSDPWGSITKMLDAQRDLIEELRKTFSEG